MFQSHMARRSREQMKNDEMMILAELQKNSNGHINTIAKHLGFSRQKTWRFIKRLEKNHMIWGYTIVVDQQRQGLQKFILSIKRSSKISDKKNEDVIAFDKIEKNYSKLGITVESSYYGHGEYDWILLFTARGLEQAKKFAELILGAYPGMVEKTRLFQILFTPREHNVFNPDRKKMKDFI